MNRREDRCRAIAAAEDAERFSLMCIGKTILNSEKQNIKNSKQTICDGIKGLAKIGMQSVGEFSLDVRASSQFSCVNCIQPFVYFYS